ncbi:hypothetical protein DID80_08020, partial [Candidatus Marinamargulisbacteria bacterium SCGC AAA071-K20]
LGIDLSTVPKDPPKAEKTKKKPGLFKKRLGKLKKYAKMGGGATLLLVGGIIGEVVGGVGLLLSSPVALKSKSFRAKWVGLAKTLASPVQGAGVLKRSGHLKKIGLDRSMTSDEKASLKKMEADHGSKGNIKTTKHPKGVATELASAASSSPEAKVKFLGACKTHGVSIKNKLGRPRPFEDMAKDLLADVQNHNMESGFDHISRTHTMGDGTVVDDVVTPTTEKRVSTAQTETGGVTASCSKFTGRGSMPTSGTHKHGTKSAGNLNETRCTVGSQTLTASRHGVVGTKHADPSKVAYGSKTVDKMTIDEMRAEVSTISNPKVKASLVKALNSGKQEGLDKVKSKLATRVSNKHKAKDLVRAAILQKLEQSGVPDDGKININLTSVSLVTPDETRGLKGGGEKKLLMQQYEALHDMESLSDAEKAELLAEITTGDPGVGLPAGATLTVSTETFNFGVNEGEAMGRSNQKGMNLEAAAHMNARITGLPDDNKSKEALTNLMGRIDALIDDPDSSGNSYMAPTLVLIANNLLDGQSAFNCASGKDRTGMADVMVKMFMTRMDANSKHDESLTDTITTVCKEFESLEDADKRAATPDDKVLQAEFRELLFHSPNLDIQQKNTGVPGYKLVGEQHEKLFKNFAGLDNSYTILVKSHLAQT